MNTSRFLVRSPFSAALSRIGHLSRFPARLPPAPSRTRPPCCTGRRRLWSLCFVLLWGVAGPAPAFAYVDPTTGSPSASNVTRRAEIPEKNWLPGHRGVDLATRTGQEILAAEDGVVAFTGVVAGVPVVSVDHADGIRTTYQPVHATVRTGEKVQEGEPIGRMAPPSGDHAGLHWGARTGKDAYINPLSLLDAPEIRLKPVDAPGRKRS